MRPQLLEKLDVSRSSSAQFSQTVELETPRKANVWFNVPEQVDQLYILFLAG